MNHNNSQPHRPTKLLVLATIAATAFGFAGAINAAGQPARAQNSPMVFDGVKSTWHDGFVRYDYVMDNETLAITPFTRPDREGFATAPRQRASAGASWSCQTIRRPAIPGPGAAVIGITSPRPRWNCCTGVFALPSSRRPPGRQWDAWYAFLTEKHGLSKKPAFIGMSMGGVYSYLWSTSNADKVSCIYADNPAIYPESILKLGELAKNDVPLLNVCGTLDFVLEKNTKVIENIYHQAGGRISIMIKEGTAHHPHSLLDPKPTADFIEQSVMTPPAPRPGIVDNTFVKSYYYSVENSYIYLPKEDTYATCRGPQFTPCYDRYDKPGRSWRITGMAVLVPKTPAAGKPWVFRADRIGPDASPVDLALLAKGFYIVAPRLMAQSGPSAGTVGRRL